MIKYDKKTVTEKIFNIIPSEYLAVYSFINNIDNAFYYWWTTGRSGNSLGLSVAGKHAFESVGINGNVHHYVINEISKMTKSYMVDLNRYMECPFHLEIERTGLLQKHQYNITLTLYDDDVSIMIELCGGIEQYLNKCRKRKNKEIL